MNIIILAMFQANSEIGLHAELTYLAFKLTAELMGIADVRRI